jgi:ABC-type polysaccharide/polyol phosphate export permease
MNAFFRLLERTYFHRRLLATMAFQELRNRYAGTFAGILWSVVHPVTLILIYWFVFTVGFKIQALGDYPFVLVFLCGIAPWFFFSESLATSCDSITSKAYLLKKSIFPAEILPLLNLLVAFITHLFMLIVLLVFLYVYGFPVSIYAIQVVYLVGCLFVLCIGIGWLISAINVFYKDVGQILTIMLNAWFWLTPIIWPIDAVPADYRAIFQFNPMYYIVEGYRAAFLYKTWIFANLWPTIYFWAYTLFFVWLGAYVFRKLKPAFGDVI